MFDVAKRHYNQCANAKALETPKIYDGICVRPSVYICSRVIREETHSCVRNFTVAFVVEKDMVRFAPLG